MRSEFLRVAPETVGIPCEAVEELLDFLEGEITEPHGLMIMRHGKVCAEGWWAPYAPGIPHDCRSLSKTFAGTAVGLAITEGLLHLDDKVIDFFPEYVPDEVSENLAKLSVRHLLTMTTGMAYESLFGDEWIRNFLSVPVPYEPGSVFMHNSKGTSMCCAIVSRVTGVPVLQYLAQKLYNVIGIRGANQKWMLLPGGIEMGGGSLFATTEDILRLMKLYLDRGGCEGERLLSEEYVHLATTPQIDNSYSYDPTYLGKAEQACGYGFQIWMCSPEGAYRADGAQGQLGIVFPKQDMIIAMNQNTDYGDAVQKYLYEKFLPALSDVPLPVNEEKWKHLKNRMSRLCLPKVPFRPESDWAREIEGRKYLVNAGRFTFFRRFENHGSWRTVTEGIKEFSFAFEPRECRIAFLENGEKRCLTAAMDGTRRRNILHSKEHFMEEALASGAWISPDTFEVRVRWIESTRERTVRFQFLTMEKVHIDCFMSQDDSPFGRGPSGQITPEPETADAIVCPEGNKGGD